ncbi:hypothetical protein [Variovorax boronicumulans]|uniref:hypothetical protein n=1 Tax=Variovorax boronicumulans TaxID=436515 RepID=UPI00277EDCD3|nr:hypothetical protein [Variovorax boronicumulans]MDQ0044488.1 hypothetical protein [Variovorax boronicumulans]
MPTVPKLPPDEAPLDEKTIDLVLSNMGTDMVLVGGQALAFWMSRFGIEPDGAAISNDGDALGKVAKAIDLAQAIKARVELPAKTSRTAIVAQLRLPAAGGRERNIDVLHKLYTVAGLKKSTDFTKRVIDDSVEVEWRPGRFIRVMDPFDVLESRAQNAVGLFVEKGPHVLTQARWAIQVAREALMKTAAANADPRDRLGSRIQCIYALARSQVGRRLLAEHQIELLDAVDLDRLRALAPLHSRQLEAVEKAKTQRIGRSVLR